MPTTARTDDGRSTGAQRADRSGAKPRAPRMTRGARREQLLRIASELMAEEGVGALTMERMAERAQVSKPVIYTHFENRAAVMLDLLHAYWTDLDQAIATRSEGAADLTGHVRAIVEGSFDASEQWGHVLLPLISGASVEQPVEAARQQHHEQTEKRWSELFTDIPSVPAPTAALLAAVLRAAVAGAATHWARHPELPREQAVDACCSLFADGLTSLEQAPKDRSRKAKVTARPSG